MCDSADGDIGCSRSRFKYPTQLLGVPAATMDYVNPSTALARTIVDQLVAGGVREVVLSPGSRNAPLSFALHAADEAGLLRLHVRVDERTAGFLALGLARGSGRTRGTRQVAAVVTTSGTAVANLHPAVLEAHHDGVPLLVLSADRPLRLRGVGANQTIEQLGVFGAGVLRGQYECGVGSGDGNGGAVGSNASRSEIADLIGAALSGTVECPRPGPVQLNCAFDVPLVPGAAATENSDDGAEFESVEAICGTSNISIIQSIDTEVLASSVVPAPKSDERCLFIVDMTNSAGIDIAALAQLGHPVISEIGGLAGATALAAGISLLECAEFVQDHVPDRIIMLGRPTLYRGVTALLARTDTVIDMVTGPAGPADVAGTARIVSSALEPVTADAPSQWSATWREADQHARSALARAVLGGPAIHGFAAKPLKPAAAMSSPVVAAMIGRLLPATATVVLGSSQPPRDFGRFSTARDGIRIVANRGVAGIDGTVSTAVGVALAVEEADSAERVDLAEPVYAVMGDLAFLHDITGLAIGPAEPRPDLTFIVLNNDGGGIFATLEQGAPEFSDSFERIFGTPIGADFAALAAGFGIMHVRVETMAELGAALAEPTQGLRIVEVLVDRDGLRAVLELARDSVAQALGYAATEATGSAEATTGR